MGIIDQISTYSILLPCIAGLIFYTRLSSISKWVWTYALLGAPPQLFHGWGINIEKVGYNIYILLEFALLVGLFRQLFYEKRSKIIFNYSVLTWILLAVIIISFNGITTKFLAELLCFNHFAYVLWILFLIKEQYDVPDEQFITTDRTLFWFLVGVFFYALATSMPIAAWDQMIDEENPYNDAMKTIHACFNTLMYVSIAFGMFKEYQQSTLKPSPAISRLN